MTEPNAYDPKKFLALAKAQLRRIAVYVRESDDWSGRARLAAGRDRLEDIQWRSDLSDDVACTAAMNAVRAAFTESEDLAIANRRSRRDAAMEQLKEQIAMEQRGLCTYEREIRAMRSGRLG